MLPRKTLVSKIIEAKDERVFRPKFSRPKLSPANSNILSSIKRLSKSMAAPKKRIAGLAAGVQKSSELHQRVVIKSRIVKMDDRGKELASANIQYITRDSVGIEGGAARAFNQNGLLNQAELDDFIKRGIDCRHQFRFIVSPEHGDRVDMESFAKDLLAQMEKDLKTVLDYVAVVHHDTDNPHVHIVVNGDDSKGNDLVISRDYISQGMRSRASVILTHELGLRTEKELQQVKEREVSLEKVTSLDRKLVYIEKQNKGINSKPGLVDLSLLKDNNNQRMIVIRNQLMGRLSKLESLSMATKVTSSLWEIDEALLAKLKTLDTRNVLFERVRTHSKQIIATNDIVLVHKDSAIGVPLSEPLSEPVTGKVIGKGLVNELYDKKYIIVSATDGKTYHAGLSLYSEKAGQEAKKGEIVTLGKSESNLSLKIERNVISLSLQNDGVYSIEKHRSAIKDKVLPNAVSVDEYLAVYRKQIELLTKRGLVQKIAEDHYKIPDDLENKILSYDKQQSQKYIPVTVDSVLSLREQVAAQGLTWIDKQIIAGKYPTLSEITPKNEFQKELADTLEKRVDNLVKLGLVERVPSSDKKIAFDDNLGSKLINLEMTQAAKSLSKQYGNYQSLDNAPVFDGNKVFYGEIKQIKTLTSGKYAVVDLGNGFTLTPLQNGMEKLQGKSIEIAIPHFKSIAGFDAKFGRTFVSFKSRENSLDRGLGL
ncbi:MAG: DUF3363 domain-containing protein [Pseudomonadota bacterium]